MIVLLSPERKKAGDAIMIDTARNNISERITLLYNCLAFSIDLKRPFSVDKKRIKSKDKNEFNAYIAKNNTRMKMNPFDEFKCNNSAIMLEYARYFMIPAGSDT